MNLAGRVDTRLKCVQDCGFAVGHLGEVGESTSQKTRNLGNPYSEKDSAVRSCFTSPYILSLPLIGYAAPRRPVRLHSEPVMQVTVTRLKQQGAAELIAAGVSLILTPINQRHWRTFSDNSTPKMT
jgi:hypothetical protein